MSIKVKFLSVVVISFLAVGFLFISLDIFYGKKPISCAGDVLIHPERLHKTSFYMENKLNNMKELFVVNNIELQVTAGLMEEKTMISPLEYSKIFEKIKSDSVVTSKNANEFESAVAKVSISVIPVRDACLALPDQVPFQIIEISEDQTFYRIGQLCPPRSKNWLYFYHPDLLEEISKMLRLF